MILKHLEYLEQVYKDKLKINYKLKKTRVRNFIKVFLSLPIKIRKIKL